MRLASPSKGVTGLAVEARSRWRELNTGCNVPCIVWCMIVGRLLCRNSRQPPHSAPNDDSFNFGTRVNSNHTHMKLRQFFRFVALWVMPILICCHKRRPIPPHVHLKVMNGTVAWHFGSNLRVCDGKTWDAGTARFGEFSPSLQ